MLASKSFERFRAIYVILRILNRIFVDSSAFVLLQNENKRSKITQKISISGIMDALTNNYGSSSEDEPEDDSKGQPETKKAKVTIEENLHLKPSTSSEFSSVKTVRFLT